jgi:hypothetical protein
MSDATDKLKHARRQDGNKQVQVLIFVIDNKIIRVYQTKVGTNNFS